MNKKTLVHRQPKPPRPPRIPSLREEINDAVDLLRLHHLIRAANRLESMSRDVLVDKPTAPKPKAQDVLLVGASGRTSKTKLFLKDE